MDKLVEQHLASQLGRPETIYSPKGSESPAVDVLEFSPGDGQEHWTYCTAGLSSRDQYLPGSSPSWLSRRIEIFIYTPERCLWAVEALYLAGRIPFEQKSWLFWWHTVALAGPINNSADCELTSLLLLPPYFEKESFDRLSRDGQDIRFLMALPISEAERKFALLHGGQALEELLLENNIDFVFDAGRASTV